MGALSLVQLSAGCSSEDNADGELDAGEDAISDRRPDNFAPDSSPDANDATADTSDAMSETDAAPDSDAAPDVTQDAPLEATTDAPLEASTDAPSDAADDADATDADAVDADVDADDAGADADAMVDSGGVACVNPAGMQTITPTMYGCPGSVIWDDRATLCASGCTVCKAETWMALDGSVQPTHHYWTDDLMRQRNPMAPQACQARPWDAGGGNACYATWDGGTVFAPMRVCAPSDAGPPNESVDPEGNVCTNWDCGFLDHTPDASNLYLGGCTENPTAGALCCCP